MLNKIELSTTPCGTPTPMLKLFENEEFTFILNDLFIIYLSNLFLINLYNSPLCHILSNALVISKNITQFYIE
jgi:hypothetical protein